VAAGLIERIADWTGGQAGVRAALLVGSRARTDTPADEWSDVDVVLFVDDPRPLLADGTWLAAFGTPLLTFVEPAAVGGGLERRVLYEDGNEVDFAVFPVEAAKSLAADPVAAGVLRRGYRVLHDDAGVTALLAAASPTPAPRRDPAEIVHDFWYHALWTAKKLRRGEELMARQCFEGLLKALLLELARAHAQACDPGVDTWHGSRFAETWADPDAREAVWEATARRPEELPAALRRLCDAFDRLAAETVGPLPEATTARDRLAGLLARPS
jgi:aminoglycoside 6-adenylyltransferase